MRLFYKGPLFVHTDPYLVSDSPLFSLDDFPGGYICSLV